MSDNQDYFIQLLWDDILCSHILPHLTLKELFVLRGLSTAYRALVDSYLGKITTLNLKIYHDSFNEAAMKVITDNCKNLRAVNLSSCGWLRDHMVIPLFLRNRSITELNLSDCDGLTTVCLQPVIVLCKDLQKLSLSGCMWVNSGCLQAFVLHQSSLCEINLDRCYLIDNDTLSYFLSKFPRLSSLSLQNVLTVDDNTLVKIAKHCQELEHLNIRSCYHITGYGVRMVCEYCRKLKTLAINDCLKVSLLNVMDDVTNRIKIEMAAPSYCILPLKDIRLNLQNCLDLGGLKCLAFYEGP